MGFNSLELKWLVQALILSGLPLAVWMIPKVSILLPLVILQLTVGILVGPSVMGQLWPEFESWLFAADAVAGLAALSFFGVTFFIFYTGLHIEKDMFFGPRATVEFWVLAFASMLCPFGIGCLLGWLFLKVWFDETLIGAAGNEVTFILSTGISIGVTALPVLSAILIEIGQLESDLGIMMIACATVHDVLLWLMITLVLGLSETTDNWCGQWQPLASLGLFVVFLLFLGFVYSPVMKKVARTRWWNQLSVVPRLVVTLCLMYLSAVTTEVLQIHTLPGVVAFGAMVPVSEKAFVMGHIDVLNRALFLPLFFGAAGLKVKLNQATIKTFYIFLSLTIGCFVGHLPGSILVAKIFKRSWKQSCIIAVCMVCKGGVEIVVATLLFARKITSMEMFCGMMLMALACTVITKPFILVINRWFPGEDDPFRLGKKTTSTELDPETKSCAPSVTESSRGLDGGLPEGSPDSIPVQCCFGQPSTPTEGFITSTPEEDPYDAPNPYSFITQHPQSMASLHGNNEDHYY